MSGRFVPGDRVIKVGGAYGGPGIVRGTISAGDDTLRYVVAHRIDGGYGEFLHIYGPAQICAMAPTDARRAYEAPADVGISTSEQPHGVAPDDAVERAARGICLGKGGRPDDTWYDEGARAVRREWERFEKEARSGLSALRPGDRVPAGVVARIDPAYDLVAHLRRQRDFSAHAFGPGPRTAGVIDHIRKELGEIEKAPDDLTEWIDVVLLAFDGAWRAGHKPERIAEALAAKLAKNESRVWPDWRTADPNKAIEHDRAALTLEPGGS
jgi:hypothetical protein